MSRKPIGFDISDERLEEREAAGTCDAVMVTPKGDIDRPHELPGQILLPVADAPTMIPVQLSLNV